MRSLTFVLAPFAMLASIAYAQAATPEVGATTSAPLSIVTMPSFEVRGVRTDARTRVDGLRSADTTYETTAFRVGAPLGPVGFELEAAQIERSTTDRSLGELEIEKRTEAITPAISYEIARGTTAKLAHTILSTNAQHGLAGPQKYALDARRTAASVSFAGADGTTECPVRARVSQIGLILEIGLALARPRLLPVLMA